LAFSLSQIALQHPHSPTVASSLQQAEGIVLSKLRFIAECLLKLKLKLGNLLAQVPNRRSLNAHSLSLQVKNGLPLPLQGFEDTNIGPSSPLSLKDGLLVPPALRNPPLGPLNATAS
jgi:hypothetical protein